jgi:CelD/BcsL family acetyltransferase involved in cellulose biosynthesis
MSNVMSASTIADSMAEVVSSSDIRVDTGPVRVTEVVDDHGFENLRPVWNRTLEQSPQATIFQSWEWQYTWLRHFGRGSRTSILLMSDGSAADQPFAIAPLVTKPYVVPMLRELTFMGVGVSDYLDVICAEGKRDAAAGAVFDYVHENEHKWDFVDLHQIPPHGLAGDVAGLAEDHPHLDAETLHHETCPVVELPSSWEDYRKTLGKSLRFNIGYYERSLRKQHDVQIGVADAENLDSEMDSLFRLHTRRWRKRWMPGVLSGVKVQAFHRDAAARLLDSGWLRLYYLKLDGVTRASLYCFAFRDTMYYYLGGFDPELAKYGLGTILTGHAIKEAIEGGCTKFDMLRGSEGYKLRWKPELRRNQRVFVRKKGLRSGAVRAMHSVEERVERVFKERVMGITGG